MAKFILKSRISAFLKNTGKSPIAEIIFLGTGGAFDVDEKNSSAVIKTANGNILIDCGSTVYAELRKKNMLDDINYVFITHSHEDHIGSLSTLIYHKYLIQKQIVKIECIPSLVPILEMYLNQVCGHTKEQYEINYNEGVVFNELNMIIHKIDTTNKHSKDFVSAGFVFNFRKNGEDLFLVYSGDIHNPFTEVISDENPKLYESLIKSPENVFIFHESTSREHPFDYPHCQQRKLEKVAEIFPNIYLFHHSNEEYKKTLDNIKQSKMAFSIISQSIDLELNKKLSLAKSYETQEKLRVQAKRLKEDFKEDYDYATLKTQDINTIGKELIIQEEMGL